eukprot:gene8562-7814_t
MALPVMATPDAKVFADEEAWFREAFSRIGPLDHHVATQ